MAVVMAPDSTSNPLSVAYSYWSDVLNGVRSLDGTYTEFGKGQLAQQEASSVVRASGGTMDIASALAIARNDVTSVLMGLHADPSQSKNLFSGLVLVLVLILAILFLWKVA